MLRFAPSPTADLHIGDLRVALFNHILSKQLNEELLIRIDDTDKEKNIDGKDKEILEILGLFSIDYSRIVHQSDNIKYHTQMGMKLLLDKKAFNCFCSDDALEQDKLKAKKANKPYKYSGFCTTISDETKFNCNAPFVVRLFHPQQNIKFVDVIKGEVDCKHSDIDSFVMMRHDKSPTYNFACGVDDMLQDISTVIRDEKYLLDTPKQINVRKSLGYDKEINYIHLPSILNFETANNISTKDIFTVKNLVEEGYLPVAISNYLILLGYDAPVEVFTLEEAMEWFDINKVSKDTVQFDISKLKSLNKEHLQMMDELRLSKILGYADKDIGILGKIYLQECDTIKEIKKRIDDIFTSKTQLIGLEKEFDILKECLQNAPFIDDLDDLEKYIITKTALTKDQIIVPLRYALTGAQNGPKLSEIYPLIKNYLGEIVK